FKRMYDPKGDRPEVARRLGNVHPGDGARYAGRGMPFIPLISVTAEVETGVLISLAEATKLILCSTSVSRR
ncbi:MAG: hypothetical protein EOO90_21515, partial [Pedobacter sp.]